MIVPRWRVLTLTTSIRPDEAQRLRELAKGKSVLEIGSAHGYSAIIMALAGAWQVFSVDPHIDTWLGDTYTSMSNNLEAFGVHDKVTIVRSSSFDAMTYFVKKGRQFEFIFLDGSAVYEENKEDIRMARMLLVRGGTLARHDYGHTDYPQFKQLLDEEFPDGPTRLTNSLFEVVL